MFVKALTVGASDENDVRSSFSDYGPCVDIFAPGEGISSTALGGGVGTYSGTSIATAHAAGTLALFHVM